MAEGTQAAVEEVGQQLSDLEAQTAKDVAAQHEKTKILRDDVDELQGKNRQLHKLFAYFSRLTPGEPSNRTVCELNTQGEALEICRLLGFPM